MKREDALLMQQIYVVEKNYKRNVLAADLVAEQILPPRKTKQKLDELHNLGFLNEIAENGANTYHTTVKGYQQMCAYRDVKRKVEAYV